MLLKKQYIVVVWGAVQRTFRLILETGTTEIYSLLSYVGQTRGTISGGLHQRKRLWWLMIKILVEVFVLCILSQRVLSCWKILLEMSRMSDNQSLSILPVPMLRNKPSCYYQGTIVLRVRDWNHLLKSLYWGLPGAQVRKNTQREVEGVGEADVPAARKVLAVCFWWYLR